MGRRNPAISESASGGGMRGEELGGEYPQDDAHERMGALDEEVARRLPAVEPFALDLVGVLPETNMADVARQRGTHGLVEQIEVQVVIAVLFVIDPHEERIKRGIRMQ